MRPQARTFPSSTVFLLPLLVSFWVISTTAEAPVVLRVGIAVPDANSSVGLPAIAETLSSEALIGLGLDGRPIPRLAAAWDASSDGQVLRFTIAPNIRFHDGRAADAEMVASLLREGLQNAGALQMHSRLRNFFQVRTEGKYTIVLSSSSARILALEELANITLKVGSPDGGLGPFVVESLNADGMQLRGYEGYFRGAPKIGRVEFQLYRSQRAAWTGMMRDATDALYEVNRDAAEFVERESRVRTHSFLRPYVSGLVFNVSHTVFRDAKVRRAIVAAVNRTAIVESAYRGRARRADGPLTPTYWALAGNPSRKTHNPELAKALLEHLPLQSRADQMPARLRFRCLVPSFETQPLDRTALIVQKQLYDFGVDMELEPVSVRGLFPRLASGDFEAVLMEFFGITPSWISYFWHSPALGGPVLLNSGYSAANGDLEAMDAARTEHELRSTLANVYRRFAEDPPAVFIAWPEVTRAVSKRFDVPVEKGRDIMGGNLWLWRPAKAQ
ncbi:MAG: ABC transporter substrate-binding protein [Acidobacteriota bacterium]